MFRNLMMIIFGAVSANIASITKMVDVFIGANKLSVLVDTGSHVDCINKATYLGIPEAQGRLLPSNRVLYPYGSKSKPLPKLGRLKVKLKSNDTGELICTCLYVIDDNSANLLSCETSLK